MRIPMQALSSAVSQAPFELIRLIKEAQQRDGRTWEQIVVAADLRIKTVEGWLNGSTRSPPLIGMAKLCMELGIPADQVLMAAAKTVDEVRRLVREIDVELSNLSPDDQEDPPDTSAGSSGTGSPSDAPAGGSDKAP